MIEYLSYFIINVIYIQCTFIFRMIYRVYKVEIHIVNQNEPQPCFLKPVQNCAKRKSQQRRCRFFLTYWSTLLASDVNTLSQSFI